MPGSEGINLQRHCRGRFPCRVAGIRIAWNSAQRSRGPLEPVREPQIAFLTTGQRRGRGAQVGSNNRADDAVTGYPRQNMLGIHQGDGQPSTGGGRVKPGWRGTTSIHGARKTLGEGFDERVADFERT